VTARRRTLIDPRTRERRRLDAIASSKLELHQLVTDEERQERRMRTRAHEVLSDCTQSKCGVRGIWCWSGFQFS
jgi:hypothetical protein